MSFSDLVEIKRRASKIYGGGHSGFYLHYLRDIYKAALNQEKTLVI